MTGSTTAMAFVGGLAAALGLTVAPWLARRRQQRALAAQVARLVRPAAPPRPYAPGDVGALPAPVARYLNWALPAPPWPSIVRLTQRGVLRTDSESRHWMPFDADHLVSPADPGFVWNARVEIAPLLHLRVRDTYISGEGGGHVSLLSAFDVAHASPSPELNAGALHRFLAEAVWCPMALLPSPSLTWTPIDATRALATLKDHDTRVSLEFHFADTPAITAIYTSARWGRFGGHFEQRRWEGHFREYRSQHGFQMPTEADVGWYTGDEWHAVWKATITTRTLEP